MGAIVSERSAEHSELGVGEPSMLGLGETPVLADRERAEAQRTEGDALQSQYGMPDGVAHATHLAIAAFADRQLELVAAAAQAPSACGRRGTVLEQDASAQRTEGALGNGRAADAHAVG